MNKPPISQLESDLFASAQEQYNHLIETLSSPEYQNSEHGDIENLINNEGQELLRRLLQGHLNLRATNETPEPDVIGSDEEPRPH